MSGIPRYMIGSPGECMRFDEHPEGKWVKWDDIKHMVLSDEEIEEIVDKVQEGASELDRREITHISLRTEGESIVVDVDRGDGQTREVIREYVGGLNEVTISHCWHNNNDGRPSSLFPPETPL